LILHGELNDKLSRIGERFDTLSAYNRHDMKPGRQYPLGVIVGGVPYAVVKDIFSDEDRNDIPVLKIGAPYPFPEKLAREFMSQCRKVLVIEETDTLLEYLLRDREKVMGRLSGHVPSQGELVPETVYNVLNHALDECGLDPLPSDDGQEAAAVVKDLDLPIRRPTLCAGCGHRAAFFAIRKLNLGAVDTCLDMGAAITMASGFYHAYSQDREEQPIVATIGDSTFFHSGPAGLLNAVYNDARFVLVILDNQTTAMTGMQPTPATGFKADGSKNGGPLRCEENDPFGQERGRIHAGARGRHRGDYRPPPLPDRLPGRSDSGKNPGDRDRRLFGV
ncbi:MAG: hypothetical protein JRF65_03630, partial [Deltaproteobacteria bacterium]|nr:hypothetical protein [Deltaproteobacteria bacterium]